MKKRYIVVPVIGVLLIGCGFNSPEPTEADQNRINNRIEESAASSSAPKKKEIQAGTWKVGKKTDLDKGTIAPGEYSITSPENGFNCYYEVVRNLEQEGNWIISNGNAGPGEVFVVKVTSKAKALVLQGECLATKTAN